MKKTIAIAFGLLLLLSLLFSTSVSPIESESTLPVKNGNISYVDNADAYISATPHTLTEDGYVYLNVTSKKYGGEVDFCFGFDSKLGYPRSLELYDPRTETIQHKLDLNPYWGNPDYDVDFSNFTKKKGETLYDGCILVYQNISIINERNQTVGWEWTKILDQNYNIADLDTKIVYWNITQTSDWTTIRNNRDFDKKFYSFQRMDSWYLGNATIEQNKEYYLRMWLTLVPTLEDVTHEYFVGFKPHDETMEQAVLNNHFHYLDPWYNGNWQYRKSHVINNATGAGTNYQVRITVHYGSDNDDDEDVYLNGKCQSDFGDIRFTDDNGTTLLDYWMEEKTYSDNAVFWVEVADDLNSSNATIYVYYGNSGASSTSNGEDTFIQFDDFANLNDWTQEKEGATETITIDTGAVNFHYRGNAYCHIQKAMTSDNIVVRAKLKWSSNLAQAVWALGLGIYFNQYDYVQIILRDDVWNQSFSITHDKDETVTYEQNLNVWTPDQWAWVRIRLTSSTVYADFSNDGLSWTNYYDEARAGTWDTPDLIMLGHGYEHSSTSYSNADWDNSYSSLGPEIDTYADQYIVRKYVDPEPTHGTWGDWEEGPGGDWLIGWQYRKNHNITSATGAGTNYQIRIHVHYGPGPDYKETVYLNGKCQPDFDDIRFTDDNGTTLLDYWLEEKTNSDNAVFWVEVADDLSSTNRTIYIYYGNSGVSSLSSGTNTFDYFDDFEGSSLGDDWQSSGTITVTDSEVTLDQNDSIYSNTQFGAGYAVRAKTKATEQDTVFVKFSNSHALSPEDWIDITNNDSENNDNFDAFRYRTGYNYGAGGGHINLGVDDMEDFRNTYHVYEIQRASDIVKYSQNDNYMANHTVWIPPDSLGVGFAVWDSSQASTLTGDWILVRKYVDPEPSHDDWGHPEERFTFPDDWQYRKNHTINSNGNAGVNYPVRIKVHYGSGTDSGEDVYLNGKCQPDFGDIRFTDYTGWTLLDYWMDEKVGNYATFWVEVTANLSVSTTTIYIYYGNENASRADDPLGLDIFQLREYDQWISGCEPNIQFAKNTSTVVLVDSYTPGNSPMGRGYVFIQARKGGLDGKRIQIRWRCYFSYWDTRRLGSVYVIDNPHLRKRNTDEFAENDGTEHPVSDYANVEALFLNSSGSGWSSWTNSTSDVLDLSSFSSEYVTILIDGADAWGAQTTMLDIDYMKVLDSNNITLKTFDFDESVVMEQTGTLRDYGLYRKYVAGYDPHGAWGNEEEEDTWYSFAFIIWGSGYYALPGMGDNEYNASRDVWEYVHDLASDTQRYANCSNFWGEATQPTNVYNAVNACETTYNYTAIFYKGHIYPNYTACECPYNWCDYDHFAIYDWEGNETGDWIIDYLIHDEVSSASHDFVFLWACAFGGEDFIGEINQTGGYSHSFGMMASWMNLTAEDLSSDGYANPDGTDHVFISFDGLSINFKNSTEYDTFEYQHFAYLFFDYALNGPFTVRDALDLAADDTHSESSYGACQLNTGYSMNWWYNATHYEVWENNKMRVWGDGDHILPN